MANTLEIRPMRLDAPLVVASDVHLKRPGDERAQLLLDVIERIGNVEYFVLNGDIFDFCLGDSAYFRKKFQGLGEALARLTARGVKTLFLEGNHEFHMRRMGWAGVEIVTEPFYVVTLASGAKIKIGHGDLITNEKLYRAFRGLVKSRYANWGAQLLPGSWLDSYALKHASLSRAQDKYRKLDHARILAAFNDWLGDGSYDHGIIGHFHVPYAEKRATHDGLMVSVDSWDLPNLLIFKDQRFQRVFLHQRGAPFAFEPAESIFRSK